jgi:hypothetical protein
MNAVGSSGLFTVQRLRGSNRQHQPFNAAYPEQRPPHRHRPLDCAAPFGRIQRHVNHCLIDSVAGRPVVAAPRAARELLPWEML